MIPYSVMVGYFGPHRDKIAPSVVKKKLKIEFLRKKCQ